MQNDNLIGAIASFRSAQELGLAYTHNRLRLPVPRSNREWMRYGYAVPPEAASVAQADGVKIDIHGAGIEIVHPDFTIDYDYGPNGECDCFDAWRLALHRHRCRGLAWPVKGQLELQALLDSEAADGKVIRIFGSPYFVHPDYRSNWTPSQTNG
jgi:hypothetical protein